MFPNVFHETKHHERIMLCRQNAETHCVRAEVKENALQRDE
jgi:hypothetical protein